MLRKNESLDEVRSRPALPEVVLIEPQVFGDERGFFLETWKRASFADGGHRRRFRAGQSQPFAAVGAARPALSVQQPQGKLVRVTRGRSLRRRGGPAPVSPTFGQWVGVELSSDEQSAHAVGTAGFRARLPGARGPRRLPLQVHGFLRAAHERTLLWNDPDVGDRLAAAAGVDADGLREGCRKASASRSTSTSHERRLSVLGAGGGRSGRALR